jgi:hypothetical protein
MKSGRSGFALVAGILFLFTPMRFRRNWRGLLLLFVYIGLMPLGVSACGGSGTLSGGTIPGNYNVTVSGSAINSPIPITEATTATLNVKSLFWRKHLATQNLKVVRIGRLTRAALTLGTDVALLLLIVARMGFGQTVPDAYKDNPNFWVGLEYANLEAGFPHGSSVRLSGVGALVTFYWTHQFNLEGHARFFKPQCVEWWNRAGLSGRSPLYISERQHLAAVCRIWCGTGENSIPV